MEASTTLKYLQPEGDRWNFPEPSANSTIFFTAYSRKFMPYGDTNMHGEYATLYTSELTAPSLGMLLVDLAEVSVILQMKQLGVSQSVSCTDKPRSLRLM